MCLHKPFLLFGLEPLVLVARKHSVQCYSDWPNIGELYLGQPRKGSRLCKGESSFLPLLRKSSPKNAFLKANFICARIKGLTGKDHMR